MTSVFQKLIKSELGIISYNRYFTYIHKNMQNKSLEGRAVYEDIYRRLKDKDIETIARMHDRLNDTMTLAFRISKTYLFAFIAYLAASIFIIAKGLPVSITIVSLVLMSVCFIFKTLEYVINKYCYVDAQIVLLYKAVLESIILGHVRSKHI
ncbi:hypothetical protein [Clostridium sp. Marseille-P299]|uniref:hypothetical protein n=1 Tax=Clostridium sp. Marseille-P299 TaxID=1805477 RepID=UPI0008337439|nr:hypothetical protein [Clostridium sp. Marseille-P299]